MVTWAKVRLVHRKSADGLVEMKDDVPLGKRYIVDLDSRRTETFWNMEHHKAHEKEIVYDDHGKYLFFELLEVLPPQCPTV